MNREQQHWEQTYRSHPGMYGHQPSDAARCACEVFRTSGHHEVLELGAGHGRDALYLARCGFHVTATDFSTVALDQLRTAAKDAGIDDQVRAVDHDAREPIPLPDASVDAVFAHMLLCMALSTQQIVDLVGEIRRVLRPEGTFIYTVRHVGDAQYRVGTSLGDDIYEHSGFAVHYFPRVLVGILAEGWILHHVHPFEEGELPRRLWRVTQTLPAAARR